MSYGYIVEKQIGRNYNAISAVLHHNSACFVFQNSRNRKILTNYCSLTLFYF